jgi:hypothetical protein
MKKLLALVVLGLGISFANVSFAEEAKKIDRNSAEHKAWVEEFRKKHNLPEKKTPAKKVEKKAPAKKAPAKKTDSEKK